MIRILDLVLIEHFADKSEIFALGWEGKDGISVNDVKFGMFHRAANRHWINMFFQKLLITSTMIERFPA